MTEQAWIYPIQEPDRFFLVKLLAWDPHTRTAYLATSKDWPWPPAVGDRLSIEAVGNFRVTQPPEAWRNPFTGWDAGLALAELQLLDVRDGDLPDLATFERPGPPTWDREANTDVVAWAETMQARVSVEAADSSAWAEFELGEQRVGVQPYVVALGLDVTDVQPGDRLTVTRSDDPYLVGRPLQVARVKGGTSAVTRQLIALDNQG